MQQQAMLSAKGKPEHFKTDQMMRWMQDRFEDGRVSHLDDDLNALHGIRTALGKMPNQTACLALAKQAVNLLVKYQPYLKGTEYSDMYAVLDSALNDLGSSVRTILRPQSSTPQ